MSLVGSLRYVAGLVLALLQRPKLVPTAIRQAATMAPSRWWSRFPYLPVPPADYVEFRTVTATGSPDRAPSVRDTIVWLEWCRSMRGLSAR